MFLFVLVAGFLGGPVAGSLESSGGFATSDADSVQAIERIEAATGKSPGSGVVLLVDTPGGLPADADRVAEVTAALTAEPGVAEVTSPTTTRGSPEETGLVSEDGTQVLVLGTLTADAEDDTLAESLLDTFEGQDDVAVGGPAVVGFQLGSTDQRGPGPGRAVRVPPPDHPVADLLPRARRTDAARRRDHHRARHLPGADRGQRGLRDEHLRAQPGDRPRPRPGDRLHAVPGDPLPRGARGPGPDRRRDHHHHAHRGPDRRRSPRPRSRSR